MSNSLQYLTNEMILAAYPDLETRQQDLLFPVFESKEVANEILDEDFKKKINDYIWYYFDKEQNDFIKVDSGEKHRIFWKR